jgi:hypothetical protein
MTAEIEQSIAHLIPSAQGFFNMHRKWKKTDEREMSHGFGDIK